MAQASQQTTRPLCILSFDGGGIRGLSSLLILQEVMLRLNGQLAKDSRDRGTTHVDLQPWQVFDMICGTSTGGLIAIMLGRLRMSVEQAILGYNRLAKGIFSDTKWWWQEGKYKATNLERAIMEIVGEHAVPLPQSGAPVPATSQSDSEQRNVDIGRSVKMLDERVDANLCRAFVCAVMGDSASMADRFRTYQVSRNPTPNCHIWEAARATSAAPSFFKPALIKDNGIEMRYIDGGLGYNNPTKLLITEAEEEFGANHQVACILSLGTGQKNTIRLPTAGFIPKLQLLGVVGLLQKIATECEVTHQELVARPQLSGVYYRFNVDQGMQGVGMDEWNRMSEVGAHTRTYLRQNPCNREVDKAVTAILTRQGSITVQAAAGH
ncbi:hypothetical protein FRC12_005242 [Ceratobasidium sp. 428]|nr:hypothetical protein FRC12_005242 [Ceratobasidium sp. 428]